MIRLTIRVPQAHAEIVLAELLELTPAGVEELHDGEHVEYAVYGAPGELPALPDLHALAGGELVEISTSEIPDDWHERWRAFHHAILMEPPARRAGSENAPDAPERLPALHVRPPWEQASKQAEGEVREIVIDPGQAFGTGAHATTRLCLELLLELASLDPPHGPVLDVGTGSGVLAIAAAALGYTPVVGLDNESESVEAACENAIVNGVEIEVRRFDLRSEPLPHLGESGAPLVVLANLLRPLLLHLAGTLASPPAHLIAGGLLREELDEVSDAFRERLGLRERERRAAGEWGALWLTLEQ